MEKKNKLQAYKEDSQKLMTFLSSSPLDFHMLVSEYTKNDLPDIPKVLKQKQLSTLRQELGHRDLIKFVYALLADLSKSFNVSKGMDEGQLIECATNIIDDFYGFRLIDFAICFRKAKKNCYGKVFNRLDMPTVYEWLTKYDGERTNEIIKLRLSYKEDIISSPRSCEVRSIKDDPEFRKVLIQYKKNKSIN